MTSARHPRPFTMVEMITAMSIILVLAAIAFTSYGAVSKNIRASRCKAQLQALSMALDKYNREYGFYPLVNVEVANATYNPAANQYTNPDGGTLVGFPVVAAFWNDLVDRNGKRLEDFEGLGFQSHPTYGFVDPFGHPWYYDSLSTNRMNSSAYDLWSVGADGYHGRTSTNLTATRVVQAAGSDDITNWRRNN